MTYLHISKWYMYTVLGAISCKHYWLLPWLRYSYFTLYSLFSHPSSKYYFCKFWVKICNILPVDQYVYHCVCSRCLPFAPPNLLPSAYPPAQESCTDYISGLPVTSGICWFGQWYLQQEMGESKGRCEVRVFFPLGPSLQGVFRADVFLSQKSLNLMVTSSTRLLPVSTNLSLSLLLWP